MTKETAFYPRLAALTDQWTELFGYWAPAVVTDVAGEYAAVRETAGLMDFSMLRKTDLIGPRAVELVNSVVTRDVTKLRQGQIAYGALCDEHGKMIDDCTVMFRNAEQLRFCGANDLDAEIFSSKGKALGVEVREFTDDMPHLCVQGPASRELLAPLLNKDISAEAFPYYTFREDIELRGIPVFMLRVGYTAELGYELWVARENALDLWDILIEEGKRVGMKVIGMDALDLFRIEGGFIIGGVEYDSTSSPYECGLGWSVNLDKGEFQGRAGLAQDKADTRLRLASVVLDGGGDSMTGAKLYSEGSEIGIVTQAIVSPHLGGKTLGLAKIDKDRKAVGTAVEARAADATAQGTIVEHPIYDPQRKRAKTT